MAATTKLSAEVFVGLVRQCGLIDKETLRAALRDIESKPGVAKDPLKIADSLVAQDLLTRWQADKLLQGRHKGFILGKYRLLAHIGSGGMSAVYLAEHRLMRRRVAIKVLPKASTKASSHLERFHREAQAVAALDHRNIVRAYDVDQEGDIHFLVMEYVSGRSLHEVVVADGQLDPIPACEYVRQAAEGLNQAHKAGMVHRDIKPGNLLLDDRGTIKVLDLGLARFFDEKDDTSVTKKHDEKVLGTADYLSPEQAIDSHGVDIRSDIYSMGCTFYFMLTGRPPFHEGTLANRLLAHQTRTPTPISSLRPDVPVSLVAIIEKMMQKNPADRFQSAREVANALADWLRENGGEVWAEMNPVIGGAIVSSAATSPAAVSPSKLEAPTITVPRPTNDVLLEQAGQPSHPNDSRFGSTIQSGSTFASSSNFANHPIESNTSEPAWQNRSPNEIDGAALNDDMASFFRRMTKEDLPSNDPASSTPEPVYSFENPDEPEFPATVLLPNATNRGENSPTNLVMGLDDDVVDLQIAPQVSDHQDFAFGDQSIGMVGAEQQTGQGGEFDFSSPEPETREAPVPVEPRQPAPTPTVQISGRSEKGGRNPNSGNRSVSQQKGRPNRVLIGLLCSGVVVLCCALWFAFGRGPSGKGSSVDQQTSSANEKSGGSGKQKKKNELELDRPPAPSRRELKVGKVETYQTLGAALEEARKNGSSSRNARQTILVESGMVLRERIVIDESWPRGIQIICAGPTPAVLDPEGPEPIVTLRAAKGNVNGFRLENFVLMGAGKETVVRLSGFLEGAQFVNLNVEGCTGPAFSLTAVQSFGSAPVLFDRTTVRAGTGSAGMGFFLTAQDDNACSRIRIRNSRLLGAFAVGVFVQDRVIDLEIEETVFHQSEVGVALRGSSGTWRNLLVAANTFYETGVGVEFAEMPGPATGGMGFFNNLFVGTRKNDVQVGKGLEMKAFLSMFSASPGGIAYNWTTRVKPPSVATEDFVGLFEGFDGRFGVIPAFSSTDPTHGDFLAPAPGSPQANVGLPQGLVKFNRFGRQVGAVRTR